MPISARGDTDIPRSGSGVYSLPPVYIAVPGTTVRAEQHNAPLQDLAEAMTGSLPRNGAAPMTGPLNMNGRKINNVLAATAPGDAPRFDQVPTLGAYLSSVSQLTFAADRISYATGAGTAALAALTAFGRSLIDDANAAAARTTLQLADTAILPMSGTVDMSVDATRPATRAAIGAAIAAAPRVGVNQTWQDFTSARTADTTYQNTTGGPIEVSIRATNDPIRSIDVAAVLGSWVTVGITGRTGAFEVVPIFTVPNGHYYRINGSATIGHWMELR